MHLTGPGQVVQKEQLWESSRQLVDKTSKTAHFGRFYAYSENRKNLEKSRLLREAPDRIRTGDLRITSASLYLLSHGSLLHNNK